MFWLPVPSETSVQASKVVGAAVAHVAPPVQEVQQEGQQVRQDFVAVDAVVALQCVVVRPLVY